MTKKEYLLEYEKICSQIKKLNDQKEELWNRYARENCGYKVGDKVRIVTKAYVNYEGRQVPGMIEIGFVSSIFVSPNGEISPKIVEARGDGTMGNRVLSIGNRLDIKSITVIG